MPSFYQLLTDIEKADFATLAESGSVRLPILMADLLLVLDQHSYADQTLGMALILGMILGTIEGQPVEAERVGMGLLTYKDRLRIFMAIAEVSTKESIVTRQMAPGASSPHTH